MSPYIVIFNETIVISLLFPFTPGTKSNFVFLYATYEPNSKWKKLWAIHQFSYAVTCHQSTNDYNHINRYLFLETCKAACFSDY